jgi:hypothetical protein
MVNDDERFPNRKRRNWDQRDLEEKLTAPNPPAAPRETAGKTAEEPKPSNGYRIIASTVETPASVFSLVDSQYHARKPEGARTKPPMGSAARSKPSAGKQAQVKPPVGNAAREYALAGIALGILFGILIATVFWHPENTIAQNDLGSLTSSVAGVKGHLLMEWDKKAIYSLTLEAADPSQPEAFELAAAQLPHPLSVGLQLRDKQGKLLCSKQIALKSDFQNQLGQNGQIAAIVAQGEMNCSRQAYDNASSWSYSTNFPTLAEQMQMLQSHKALPANEERSFSQAAPTRKKSAGTPLMPFSVEGDDLIDNFNATTGMIATRGKRIFNFDKSSQNAADSRWQDYPVSIHYKCNQSGRCTIQGEGLGVLRAALKR